MTQHHHERQVCEHGTLLAQCKCMAEKVDRIVPCPGPPVCAVGLRSDDGVVRPPEAPGLDLPCPHCGVEVGEHTLREYGLCTHAQGLNYHTPHQVIEGGPVMLTDEDDHLFAGSIDVAAMSADTALGKLPILGFRFHMANEIPGSKILSPWYCLVGDVPMMERVVGLVRDNAKCAIDESRK